MANPDIQETQQQKTLAEATAADKTGTDASDKKAQVAAQVTRQAGGAASGQSEMPFALIQGEPLTVIPQDLYIPPNALEVILEAFEGPLDLLLYLIKRQNIDILEIPLEETTRQYMQYIDLMQNLKIETGGRIFIDGRHAGRDQVAHAVTATGRKRRRRRSARRTDPPFAGIRTFQRCGAEYR